MNTGVKPQCYVLSQDRKALGLLFNRNTCPSASRVVFCSDPGSGGRKILKPVWIPGAGHALARTNAPLSLMSRVRPSPRFVIPLSTHQNTTSASNGNRMTFRVSSGPCNGTLGRGILGWSGSYGASSLLTRGRMSSDWKLLCCTVFGNKCLCCERAFGSL